MKDDLKGTIDSQTLEKARLTKFPSPILENSLSNSEKIDGIAKHFYEIMKILGLDLEDESLKHSPERVAKMYVEEVFSGLDPSTFPEISLFEDKFQHNTNSNTVFLKIKFSSFCEHHFVPMEGIAYISYIPNKKLIGLSKISRIVRFFSKRPQVQERLAAQIADSLATILNSETVAVSLCAKHHCMTLRDTENDDSHVITNVLKGNFEKDSSLRQSFFDAIKIS